MSAQKKVYLSTTTATMRSVGKKFRKYSEYGVKKMISEETRREAFETVDKKKRQTEIKEILTEFPKGLTAKETAVLMYSKGIIPTSERNFTAPRLNEMKASGIVEIVGKKKCRYTNKTVSVYALRG